MSWEKHVTSISTYSCRDLRSVHRRIDPGPGPNRVVEAIGCIYTVPHRMSVILSPPAVVLSYMHYLDH